MIIVKIIVAWKLRMCWHNFLGFLQALWIESSQKKKKDQLQKKVPFFINGCNHCLQYYFYRGTLGSLGSVIIKSVFRFCKIIEAVFLKNDKYTRVCKLVDLHYNESKKSWNQSFGLSALLWSKKCKLQMGLAQYKNAAMPFSACDNYATNQNFQERYTLF